MLSLRAWRSLREIIISRKVRQGRKVNPTAFKKRLTKLISLVDQRMIYRAQDFLIARVVSERLKLRVNADP